MNVRELGGYRCVRGRTLMHRFVRSGSTAGLTRADARALWAYGVRGVLDLRGADEAARAPEPLCDMLNVSYLNVGLYDYDITHSLLSREDETGGYLVSTYLQILANFDAIRRAFSFFVVQPERSCTLFHCGAGSDRTGVVAMLLLGLAGVSRDDIIADYAYSFGYIPEINAALFENTSASGNRVRSELQLRIDAMGTLYDRLIQYYGSVPGYLTEAGVTTEEQQRVRMRLVGWRG